MPDIDSGEALIKIEFAGVGSWEPFEREGGYVAMQGTSPSFPYILGSEGAGVIVAVGDDVDRFEEGDYVYAAGFLNPKGDFMLSMSP
ncbi:MAG: alcohol dehydrogenase catalytic domain-containing protein [Chloroflexota bacterium]